MTFVTPKKAARRFYVYGLVDPRDGHVFYIGKGCGNRYAKHVLECRSGVGCNRRKMARIASILGAGYEVGVAFLATDLTEAAAFRLERHHIAESKGPLTNYVPGSVSPLERAYEKARDLLVALLPFRQWAAQKTPGTADIALYRFVVTNLIENHRRLRASVAAQDV